jgi:hypothetical protein
MKICAENGQGTVCNATPGVPTVEVCNNLDDNCNGQVDEGLGTVSCGRGGCEQTVAACLNGQLSVCLPKTPQAEICGNDIDEDCNGSDLPCVTTLAIAITGPANLSSTNRSTLAVSGTVDLAATEVTCNGRPAGMNANSFGGNVPLKEGSNIITCVAEDGAGNLGSASISVTLDSTPPRVTIDSPQSNAVVTTSPISVTGLVNDLVMSTVNGDEAGVRCNGIQAQVANRRFVAEVALTAGANSVTCVGEDKVGNIDTAHITVALDTTAPNMIQVTSGNNQTAEIGAVLAEPLEVMLTENGSPAVNKVVVFRVLQNDGVLSATTDTLTSANMGAVVSAVTTDTTTGRILAVTTDADGRASVQFKLGSWAGAGNNQVEAMATGFVGEARFNASATPAGPHIIVVDAGNMQFGAVERPLPKPFIATVIDHGSNRLGGVAVTFRVVQGGGNFAGQSEKTVTTDSDGRAQVVLTLGPDEGFDNNVVEAGFSESAGSATFTASGKKPGRSEDTKISGVVLDNSNNPIQGVTLHVEGTTLTTQSNEQGQFVLQPAPVGHIKLMADGATAPPRDGKPWPKLEYELVTISGQNNTIGMPIYLLPIDTPNGLLVDETHGGTLTIPDVPGFSLTILPGSTTFPDGSKRGTVSVTMVHPDKVPMVPNFGQQPRFIVTIQPAGTHFNPPAPLTVPNADGFAPGQKTEMYSFDHDLGSFVSIGPGTVSEDGAIIASDPGVGVIKGGWHCGGNPTGIGTCEHECDDGNDCTEDFSCVGGTQCCHVPVGDGKRCRDSLALESVQLECRPSQFPDLFGPSTVNLKVDDSCKGICLSGQCRGDHTFEVLSAGTTAINKICKDACIMSETLRDTMAGCLERSGFKLSCVPLESHPDACAEAKVYETCGIPSLKCSNEAKLGPNRFFDPGCTSRPLSSTVLHEMVHATACDRGADGHSTNQGTLDPDDRVFGCTEACFPGGSGGRGSAEACQ